MSEENVVWQHIGNIRGPKGDTGSGLKILDFYETIEALSSAITNPSHGDAYGVGSEPAYDIYIYSQSNGWVNTGALQPDINEQTPNYAEAATLETLTSGEKISIAFGKIKKAISELISHKADTTNHITADERTAWNKKAPSGHGLGDVPDINHQVTMLSVMAKGCGFYQVDLAEDNPADTGAWLNLLQFSRDKTVGDETGVQAVLSDKDIKPRMWLRAMQDGIVSDWVEVLHTGNVSNHNIARIETQPYTGNGKFGLENARTFTFSFKPKMFFISGYGCAGGNYTLTVPYGFPFAHTIAHNGDSFATMSCEFQYNGNSITMYNVTSANLGFNTDGKPYTITAIG